MPAAALLSQFFFPFFHEEFVVAFLEAHLDVNGVAAFKQEHVVFSKVQWKVDQVFAVFPSEQVPLRYVRSYEEGERNELLKYVLYDHVRAGEHEHDAEDEA